MALGVQSGRRIDDEHIRLPGEGGIAGIVRDGPGIGALVVLDDLHAESAAPLGQLGHGGGAVRVTRGQDDLLALLGQVTAQLGHAGGFA